MIKKSMSWKTKGMNRDLSVSAFNPEFAFENRNLRLSTNEKNTLLSWVNEKGTYEITINEEVQIKGQAAQFAIHGIPIGTAVLNHQLIIFTTDTTTDPNEEILTKEVAPSYPDRIYKVWYSNEDKTEMLGKLLFEGYLNFSALYPLETLVSYEAEYIQKVYWVDGLNQPRVINIADEDTLAKWQQEARDGKQQPFSTYFDFVPAVELNENIEIEKRISAGGLFAPGVIQYAFTYVNKHGQQSNIFYVSPIYYLALSDRGASPEEKVTCCFDIKMANADQSFDYVRIYSIQRTSLDLEPFVKLLTDIPVSNIVQGIPAPTPQTIYVDAGTTGSNVDPTELLFIGGKETIAYTIADKDQTLFLGNLTQKNTKVSEIQDYIESLREELEEGEHFVKFTRDGLPIDDEEPSVVYTGNKTLELDHTTGIYSHTNMLNYNKREITTFKGGENYRFGFQLQKHTGEWSEPIYLDDVTNDKYPYTEVYSDEIKLPFATSANLDLQELDLSAYKRIRPVIVYPNISDRKVLCQGVLNPTVFNARDRVDNSPFAQASWYFRPYMATGTGVEDEDYTGNITFASEVITDSDPPAIAIPTGFDNSVSPIYVLVADMQDSYMDTVLKTGSLYFGYTDGTTSDYHSEKFSGAIRIGNSVNDVTRWAFIFNTYRQTNFVRGATYDYNRGAYNCFMCKVINPGVGQSDGFYMYTGLYTTADYRYYYKGTDVDYEFKFYIWDPDVVDPNTQQTTYQGLGKFLYTITFAALQSTSSGDYTPVVGEDSGSPVNFVHYDSLYSSNTDTNVETYDTRKVEIQGAVDLYPTPFGTRNVGIDSNTQFFVDQSIVTLNSPDVEFDTEVQVYGNEGLKLRIIGAIPITANVSAHSILASTPMLEKYHGNNDNQEHFFGTGELDYNVLHNNIELKAGNRLVSEYLWNDTLVKRKTNAGEGDNYETSRDFDWLIYPWHRSGSLNNDYRAASEASSLLDKKKESNLFYSINSEYFESHLAIPEGEDSVPQYLFEHIDSKIHLTENEEIFNIRLPKQMKTSSEVNYYPNIDKVLYNSQGYMPVAANLSSVDKVEKVTTPVSMKYKSTSHAIIALDAVNKTTDNLPIPLLPYAYVGEDAAHATTEVGKYSGGSGTTFWGNTVSFTQDAVNLNNLFVSSSTHQNHNFLWLGELYKEPANPFGGRTPEAYKNNVWLVGGDAVNLDEVNLSAIPLYWTEGDTYYERYDCLKTYAFTSEDPNQLVEILSFMCETHVNIDGRYDKNRGQTDNRNMHPMKNFNLMNPVYSQSDNFFSSKISDIDANDKLHYPNHIYYSKTKTSGADVDLWTNITLASTLELDGDKGEINALTRLNDQVLAFQDTGIAQVLYNENVQISTNQGVPIEIANSGKVQGKRYLSDTIGCTNKWSMTTTPSGIYFMDSNEKSIFLFNGQLQNLSTSRGFNTWSKQNIPGIEYKWNPVDFGNFVSYYDKQNQDVLFINDNTALAYSEKVQAFTSFYDYGAAPYFVNLDDTGIWINQSYEANADSYYKLFEHQTGNYCNFFGANKPYHTILVANPEPQIDKVFSNLEFRACVDGEGTYTQVTDSFVPKLPFDKLETWNEYQHGLTSLQNMSGHNSMIHHMSQNSALKRDFRIWRCDIPRDNVVKTSSQPASGTAYIRDADLGITRYYSKPNDRMRNPWMYAFLCKGAENPLSRVEIHDIMLTYFT